MIKVLLILLIFAHSYALSLSVQPGDTVEMEVFAKYVDVDRKTEGKEAAAIIASVLSGGLSGGIGNDGAGIAPLADNTQTLPFGAILDKHDETDNKVPKAYLNWIVFDHNFRMINGGYVRISEAAREDGSGKAHEQLSKTLAITAPGYLYVYVSNENGIPREVYFDDFSVTLTQGPVIQVNEYYPYGLPAYTYVRTGEKETKEKFQGKEYNDKTGLYDFHARQYDAALGRFNSLDPRNQFASGYAAMGNNPVMGVDPDGQWVNLVIGAVVGGTINWAIHGAQFNAKGLGYFAVGAVAGALGAGIGAGVSSALAGGSFGAGFAGSSAALTATSSFATGAAIGGSGGFAGGFVGGFGNGLVSGQNFGQALGSGLRDGLIGGISGGVLGGVTGGIDAVRDGRRFFDGATVQDNILVDRGIPFVQQNGDYNCGPANAEAISKSRGGNITQESIRNSLGGDPDTTPLGDKYVMDKFSQQSGIKVRGHSGGLSSTEINNLSRSGYDINFNIRNEGSVGHAVTLNRITERTINKVSGKVVTKYLYDVMNPARGQYIRVSPNTLWNAYNTFIIWP